MAMKWYNFRNGGRVPPIRRNTGGAATPSVQTGIPQGGFARPALDTYLAGTNPYQIDFSPYSGTGSRPLDYGHYTPPPVATAPAVPEEVVDVDSPTVPLVPGGGGGTDALPAGAVGVVGDPTVIGGNPVYEAVVPTGPVDTNVHSSVLPAEDWTSGTVKTPTGQDIPIFGPGTEGVADAPGTWAVAPPVTGIPVIDNLIGDPVNFSQATENPDGTINVPEVGPGTNDTGSIGFQDVLQAPDNYQGIPNVGEAFQTNFTGQDATLNPETGEVEIGNYEQPTITVDSSNTGNLSQPTGINIGAVTPYSHVSGDPSLSSTNQLAQQESASQPGQYVKQPDGTYKFEAGETASAESKKEAAKAEIENLAKSGNASSHQINTAARAADLSGADTAALIATGLANKSDSKADKARQAANVAVSEVLNSGNAPDLTQYKDVSDIHSTEVIKIAAENGFQTTNSTGAREFLEKAAAAQETKAILDSGDSGAIALHTGDRGDLKSELRKLGVSYKKDDSSTKLKSKLEAARAAVPAPPPVQTPPPPQPVAQASPVQAAPTPPPQPVAQVTPAPAPVAPTPAPTPAPVLTPPPAVITEPAAAAAADPFDWANNPNNPANAGAVPTIVPIDQWENTTPQRGK